MNRALLIVFTLFSQVVFSAEQLRLQWTHPVYRTNGDALKIDEIDFSTVIYTCNGKTGTIKVLAPDNYKVVGYSPNVDCFYEVTTTLKDGSTSEKSEAFKFEKIPEPEPIYPALPPTWDTSNIALTK